MSTTCISPLSSTVTLSNPDVSSLSTPPSSGSAPLLELPTEILQYILKLVLTDDVSNDDVPLYFTQRMSLFKKNVLPTCQLFLDIGLSVLYAHVHIGHPRAFETFRHEIEHRPQLRSMVRSLDFSDFTSVGLGRTRKMNREIQMVTSSTISDALSKLPQLREFLASEAIEDDMSTDVLQRLFLISSLEAVDFCGASSRSFVSSFSKVMFHPETLTNLTRVSFHGCVSLPASSFTRLLPLLVSLTQLDLTYTQVTSSALISIPHTVQLTHLALTKCRNLDPDELTAFLTSHPAVTSGHFVWLSLHLSGLSEENLTSVLLSLAENSAHSLRHLSLYGLPVREFHLKLIPSSVVELSLGSSDINLETIITNFSTRTNLRYLDLSGNKFLHLGAVQDMRLLSALPFIRTWEFDSSKILAKLVDLPVNGYTAVMGQGRRAWLFKGVRKRELRHSALDCTSPFGSAQLCQHVLGKDMASSQAWSGASKKFDVAGSEYGGPLERGLYLYYGYRLG
ncbi:uncharacterized protein V1516DRAFT_708629 [Lipomyces oligophaga]|uniref:uncharacterized protein n=1 Tax=Lipomyces oligophaga TaxID=45792 RepID=UPI0034CD3AEA